MAGQAEAMSGTDVTYSCASCAYPLNLKSSDKDASSSSSALKKSARKDYVCFHSIDISRFTQQDEITCFPVFFGQSHPRTKLLCRKCSAHLGHVCQASTPLCGLRSPRSSNHRFYLNRQALQPSTEF